MDIIQSSNRVINRFPTLNNITPFTRVDGWSFLEVLEGLRNYVVNVLVTEIDAKNDAIVEQLNQWFEEYTIDFDTLKDNWQNLFDVFMQNVVAELEALNDEAAANLVRNELSNLRLALNDNFIQQNDGFEYWVNNVTGSDTASGAQSTPFKTFQHAADMCMKVSTKPGMSHKIHLNAGLFTERVRVPDETPHNFKIEVIGAAVGGHPNVPITVFTEGNGIAAQPFITRNPAGHWVFTDIMFNGYNGSASSTGLANVRGKLTVNNCHFNNCYYGASSSEGFLSIPDGVYKNCGRFADGTGGGAAIRSIANNRHAIGKQGNGTLSDTVLIEDCYRGALVQENCSGHFDYITIRECERGIGVLGSARVNATGTRFEYCDVGIYATSGSNFFAPDSTIFLKRPGQVSYRLFSNSSMVGSRVIENQDESLTVSSATGMSHYDRVDIASEPTIFFRETMLAGAFNEPRFFSRSAVKMLSTRTVFKINDGVNASTRSINIRTLGANIPLSIASTVKGRVIVDITYRFIDNNSQIMEAHVQGTGIDNHYISEWSYDMTNGGEIHLTANTTNALDSMYALYTETTVRL